MSNVRPSIVFAAIICICKISYIFKQRIQYPYEVFCCVKNTKRTTFNRSLGRNIGFSSLLVRPKKSLDTWRTFSKYYLHLKIVLYFAKNFAMSLRF